MIILSNFVRNANDFTLLLTMGRDDTVDMLPTAAKPFSPEYYPVPVDYGVPAAGSVAINYYTQENFMFVNGAWGKDSIPSVLEQLEIDENGVYVPREGVDGYDKVTVDVPQLDTSDATADAADILSPKTAYVNGQKITGTIELESGSATPAVDAKIISPSAGKYFDTFTVEETPLISSVTVTAKTVETTSTPVAGYIGFQKVIIEPTPSSDKTVTPTKAVQNITPNEGELLSSVTVNAIPAQYIVPTGTKNIVANGNVDVTNFASVDVAVPQLDTADATAIASDLLSPKTAYVNGAKITGTLETESGTGTPKVDAQIINPTAGKLFDKFTIAAAPLDAATNVTAGTANKTVNPTSGKIGIASITVAPTPSSAKTVTPTKSVQNVTPESGQFLSGVTVNAIPAQYIIPAGSQTITENGTVDVTALASVSVNVPSTDIYKHDITLTLSDRQAGATSVAYDKCEIRWIYCDSVSGAYDSWTQSVEDGPLNVSSYYPASIKVTSSAGATYYSQFIYNGQGDFTISNFGGVNEAKVLDNLTGVTITDTVTKIS